MAEGARKYLGAQHRDFQRPDSRPALSTQDDPNSQLGGVQLRLKPDHYNSALTNCPPRPTGPELGHVPKCSPSEVPSYNDSTLTLLPFLCTSSARKLSIISADPSLARLGP